MLVNRYSVHLAVRDSKAVFPLHILLVTRALLEIRLGHCDILPYILVQWHTFAKIPEPKAEAIEGNGLLTSLYEKMETLCCMMPRALPVGSCSQEELWEKYGHGVGQWVEYHYRPYLLQNRFIFQALA